MDFSVRPDDFTDAGNAQVFRQYYKGLMVYTDALGWLEWNGHCWQPGDHAAYVRAVKLTGFMMEEALVNRCDAHRRLNEANYALSRKQDGAAESAEQAKRDMQRAQDYLDHAKRSRQAAKLSAMVELAKHDMVIPAAMLDADPYLLNTPAGEVDLRTGEITEHNADSPWHYCTRMTAAAPGHTMKGTTLWYYFLEKVCGGSNSLSDFLQRAVGMSLLGKVCHEGILLACGSGRNGKSTFFNAVSAVLGSYAGNLDVKVLTCERQNRGPALATLRGKRLVLASELEEGQRLSASVLKQLASTDKLVIEEKYHAPESVEQTHTLVLFTNHLPRVGSNDEGTWRRLCVVPFRAVIDAAQAIPNYAQVLAEEAGADILSWAIEGARLFLEDGGKLNPPTEVAQATAEYRSREDWLARFLAERTRPDPAARTGARELYQAYRAWAEECGEYVRAEKNFAEGMKGKGFEKKRGHSTAAYLCIRLA